MVVFIFFMRLFSSDTGPGKLRSSAGAGGGSVVAAFKVQAVKRKKDVTIRSIKGRRCAFDIEDLLWDGFEWVFNVT